MFKGGLIMAWTKEWTNGEYTEEDVKKLGEALVKAIQDNSGEFTGKITDIAKLAVYISSEDDEVENYGGIYRAMQEVKEKYGIISQTKGRNGNIYTLENKIKAANTNKKEMSHIKREQEIINTLRNMLNLINLDSINGDEAIGILKSFKIMLK